MRTRTTALASVRNGELISRQSKKEIRNFQEQTKIARSGGTEMSARCFKHLDQQLREFRRSKNTIN